MEDNQTNDIQEDATEITEESATSDETSTTDDTEEIVETDEEPPVRKSAKDFIIERKEKKIQKLQAGEAEEPTETKPDDTRSMIREEIGRAFEPFTRSLAQTEDEKELQAAFEKYPDAKKIEKTVRRHMAVYNNVPAVFIVRSLLHERSAKKAAADMAAEATRTGGHTRRPTDTKLPDFSQMTDNQFADWERKQNR